MRALGLGVVAALLFGGTALAGSYDPAALPTIGGMAPAFGLTAFRTRTQEDDIRDVVQLDDHCGMRPGDTSTVLVAFIAGDGAAADLNVLNQWERKYARDGLVAIAISTDSDNTAMSQLVAKSRGTVPVLDDQFGVVARRYGLSGGPFTLLLDSGCLVLGMSNKSASVDADRLSAAIDERSKAARAAR
jgi:hypothetical protein